jgi:hypothetical protein
MLNPFKKKKKLYTLDRKGSLTSGLKIKLIQYKDIEPPPYQKHIDLMFPQGVSNHGDLYFLSNKSQSTDVSSQIEILAEYVRRSNYKMRPSRFQSFFAVDNLEQIKQFSEKFGNGTVYEIETRNYFKADMNWLFQGNSILSYSHSLHEYWKGNSTTNPFWEYLLIPPFLIK